MNFKERMESHPCFLHGLDLVTRDPKHEFFSLRDLRWQARVFAWIRANGGADCEMTLIYPFHLDPPSADLEDLLTGRISEHQNEAFDKVVNNEFPDCPARERRWYLHHMFIYCQYQHGEYGRKALEKKMPAPPTKTMTAAASDGNNQSGGST